MFNLFGRLPTPPPTATANVSAQLVYQHSTKQEASQKEDIPLRFKSTDDTRYADWVFIDPVYENRFSNQIDTNRKLKFLVRKDSKQGNGIVFIKSNQIMRKILKDLSKQHSVEVIKLAIKYAREFKGIGNKKAEIQKKIKDENPSFSDEEINKKFNIYKKISAIFQTKCKEADILSGRDEDSLKIQFKIGPNRINNRPGLRLRFIPDDIFNELVTPPSSPKSINAKHDSASPVTISIQPSHSPLVKTTSTNAR